MIDKMEEKDSGWMDEMILHERKIAEDREYLPSLCWERYADDKIKTDALCPVCRAVEPAAERVLRILVEVDGIPTTVYCPICGFRKRIGGKEVRKKEEVSE